MVYMYELSIIKAADTFLLDKYEFGWQDPGNCCKLIHNVAQYQKPWKF